MDIDSEADKAIVPLIDLTLEFVANGVLASALVEDEFVDCLHSSCSESDSPHLLPV